MLVFLSLALLIASDNRAAGVAETVPIAERSPLVILVQSPERAAASMPDLVSIAAPIFARNTSFDVVDPWHAGVAAETLDACTMSPIGCWYRQVARARKNSSVLLLGFFAGAQGTGQVEVEALYFDAKTSPDIETVKQDEELERLLLESAPDIERKALMKNDRQSIKKYFTDLVATGLKTTLENNGRWQNLGDIVLSAPTRALSIELDGQTRTAHGPRVRLQGVEPGQRSLVVREAGETKALYQGTVEVRALAESTVHVEGPSSAMESVLFWSGTGAIALGATVSVLAATKNTEPSIFGCDAQKCPKDDDDFVSFCGRSEGCSFFGATRMAPLGYSLIFTGMIWMLGELLTPEDLAWLPLVAGVAGGFGAYGVSVAID